jgi:6,7-dimethyl-8-ribityllumazine synthase
MSEKGYTPALAVDAAAGWRFGVVVSRFNEEITEALLRGAQETLRSYGAANADIEVVRVPGAFELPIAAALLASRDDIHAVICLGALIRGETPHFDVLAHSTANALQDVAREFALPVGFGLLTCDTGEQASARAGGARGNKGADAAEAAIEMVGVFAASEA